MRRKSWTSSGEQNGEMALFSTVSNLTTKARRQAAAAGDRLPANRGKRSDVDLTERSRNLSAMALH